MSTIKSTPVTPTPVSSNYIKEPNTFSDIDNANRFPVPAIRVAKNSPPLIIEFQQEMSLVHDKVTNKLWMMVNGSMVSVQFA